MGFISNPDDEKYLNTGTGAEGHRGTHRGKQLRTTGIPSTNTADAGPAPEADNFVVSKGTPPRRGVVFLHKKSHSVFKDAIFRLTNFRGTICWATFKWATTKRKKAKTDVARAKSRNKLIKEISIAAKLGGGNPTRIPGCALPF